MHKLAQLIKNQLRSPRFWMGAFVVSACAALVLMLVSHPAHFAFAQDAAPTPDNANSVMNELFKQVWGGIIGGMTRIAVWALNLVTLLITTIILPGQKNLILSPEVQTAWSTVRNISNILFFVALFVFSVMIITRQGGYNFKKSITALLTAAILANLSFQIGLLIIEAGDALRNSAAALIPSPPPIAGPDGQPMSWYDNFAVALNILEFDDSVGFGTYLIATSAIFAQVAVMVYVFFRLAFLLVERAIRLAMNLIFAPFQAAASILPQKELQELGKKWFGEMIKWTLVLPLSFIIVAIAQLLLPDPGRNALDFITMVQNMASSTDTAGANTADVFKLIAGIAIVYAAAGSAKMLSVVPQGITSALSKTQNAISGYGKTAWKYTGGAAGKAIQTNATNVAKNAGFKLATSTAPGRKIYEKIAGNIARRKEIPEQQAKQRQLFVQKAANIQIREQYVATQNRVKRNRDRIAQTLYRNDYGSLTEKQKDRVNQAYRSPASWAKGGALATIGARNLLDAPRSGDLAALEAIEGKYMGIVGKAVNDEYEIGKSPEDTRKMFDDSRAKVLANPNDSAAQWDMIIATEVLRRQGLRNPGKSGERAAEYYNEIVSDPTNLQLRESAGAPAKFSTAPLSRGGNATNTLQAYQSLTQADQEYETLRSRITDRTSTALAGQTDLTTSLATTNNATLNLVSNPTTNLAAELATANKGDVDLVSGGGLSQADTNMISQITNRVDLSPDTKTTQIQAILTGAGMTNATSASAIARAIAQGVRLTDLTNAHNIARGLQGPNATEVQHQIEDLQQLQSALARRNNAQEQVNNIPIGQSYAEGVRTATTATSTSPAATTRATLASDSQTLLDAINQALAAHGGPRAGSANSGTLGLTPAQYDSIATLLNQTGHAVSISPNHTINTGDDVRQHLNNSQILSAMHQIHQAASRPGF